MIILNKEFKKYLKPRFFNVGRIIVYALAVILLLGVYNTTDMSEPTFIHFYIMCLIALLGVAYDAIVGIKKSKTYENHKVQFMDEYILFTDHHGTFKLSYDEVKSYQLMSGQILIRMKWNRFVISGKHHGINIDELKQMVDFLVDKEVQNKKNNLFIYFLVMFLVINYGSQYLFVDVMGLPVETSMFLILYLVFIIAFTVVGFERYQLAKLKPDEE